MDSTTTNVCEWCKRPFLPPGAKVTGGKAMKQPGKSPEAADSGPQAGAPEAPAAAVPAEPTAAMPLAGPPLLAGAAAEEAEAPAPSSSPASAGELLRPLGAQPPRTAAESQPFPGTGAEGAGASVDVSQYVGSDQSIFRPMEKPRVPGSVAGSADRMAEKRRAAIEREQGPEIPENIRLLRASIGGAVVALVVTLVEFFVKKEMPPQLIGGVPIPIPNNTEFSGALVYAALLAVLLGFMLSAMLVRFKLGPFAGLIMGLVLGAAALSNNFPWGLIAGGLAGIICGVLATKGMRRVINV
jgi:hypothetical protein